MPYARLPDAHPTEYVVAIITMADGNLVASLSTSGPVAEGADYVFVPIEDMAPAEALRRGADIASKAGKQFFVELRNGASWNDDWGQLGT